MQISWNYPIFLYTGITFFIIHLLLYGLGLDQSYFGLLLAYIGYSKIGINQWILLILWFGIILEGVNLSKIIYKKYFKPDEEEEQEDEEEDE